MRSLARECVYKYLFSRLFNQDDEGLFDVLTKDLNEDDKNFAKTLLSFAEDNREVYLNRISEMAHNFKLERIFNSDKIVLIIAFAELDNFKETPTAVIVDEAVKICATYSAERSTDFVNGILAEYARGR